MFPLICIDIKGILLLKSRKDLYYWTESNFNHDAGGLITYTDSAV
jgi:hypothetical protein